MNAKSIRLEAARLAASLDPGDVGQLLGSATDIADFITGVSSFEGPLFNRLGNLEKLLYNLQPKWEGVPRDATMTDLVDKPAETLAHYAKPKPKPRLKKTAGARSSAKRTAARS